MKKKAAAKKKALGSQRKHMHPVRAQAEISHSARRDRNVISVLRVPRRDAGFSHTESGRLLIPISRDEPIVPPSKIKAGIKSARRQIEESMEELLDIFSGSYHISQIELEISFSADGKFLGFGVGGATSMKVVIAPDSA